jgi:autotransporter-associated beta strand protein
MRSIRLSGLVVLALTTAVSATVQTPEQRADPSTGQIPNSAALEFYAGPVLKNQSVSGYIQGALYPNQASLTWYKYVSDGVTPVSFDMYGTDMGFSLGGFGASNFGELAVYNANGQFVAGNQGARTPADGDSKVATSGPTGAPPAPSPDFSQPLDPTSATYHYSSQWFHDNDQGLPVVNFVNNAQPAPTWNPSNPYYNSVIGGGFTGALADWGEYNVLPAGSYFIAVTGYSTYFAGDPHDISTAGTDSANPFGFVTYHAMTGTYQLNVRIVGDFNQDSVVDQNDLSALLQNINALAPSSGIPLDPSSNTWVGMPASLQPYDITGNGRVDKYDLRTFERYTGIYMTRTPLLVSTLDGSGTVTIDATAYTVANGGNFSGTLQDITLPGNLILTGGTLTLTGNNTWSGGTLISGGTLSIGSEANLGDLYSDVTLNGGALQVTGTSYVNTYRTFVIGANGGTINIADPTNTLTITSTITVNGAFTKAGPGTLAIGANFKTTAPITITGGTLQFNVSSINTTAGISGAGNLSIVPGASLVSDGISLNALSVGGSVQIRSNGTSTSKFNSLTLAGSTDNWTGAFDFTNNKVIVEDGSLSRATTIATLQNQLAYGKTHSAGIFSSTSLASNMAIALLDNNILHKSTFGGLSIDSNAILIAPELLGDANADGHVDLTDLSTILNNFGTTTSAWSSGNFDGAATIDLTDLSDVLNNFGLTNANSGIVNTAAAAPEPASLLLLALASPIVLRRRFHRKGTASAASIL